jgi:RNA polymerase sigma factor (sigma-70 family)
MDGGRPSLARVRVRVGRLMPAQAPQEEPARNANPHSDSRRVRLLQEVAARHQRHLRAVARRHSATVDDADDALQSAYVIFIARFDQDDQYAVPWLTTTLKREAWGAYRRRQREGVIDDEQIAEHLFGRIRSREPEPAERALVSEQCRETARLLEQLKPNEHKALGLLAAGYSYREIMELTDWTYTKVNRLVAEGRDRLRRLAREADG